jgi:RecA-family ATPase
MKPRAARDPLEIEAAARSVLAQQGPEPEPIREPHLTTVEELIAMKITKPMEAIEGLVTTSGAWVVQGVNKSGKTILCAQLALDFYHQFDWLGEYRMLSKGPVLFIEKDDRDGFASMQDIISKYPHRNGAMPGFSLIAGKDAKLLSLGPAFYEYLERIIKTHDIKLLVIDSYTALRGSHAPGTDVVKAESYDFGQFDELAGATKCLILILHHESKGAAHLDWDQRGAGSFAIGHAVSGLIRIDRFRELPINAPERLVQIRGRHVKGAELVLSFQESTLNYKRVMDGPAASLYPTIQQLRRHFAGRDTFTAKNIYGDAGMMSRATTFRVLERLVYGNILTRHDGQYRWSDP